jgi:dTDP-glucose pyrophosphorylase
MRQFKEHIIKNNLSIKQALERLDMLAKDAILFVVDELGKLQGSLTDGDVRRGLLNGVTIDELVIKIIQSNPKFILKSNYDLKEIIDLRSKNYKVFPVIDNSETIINIINFRLIKSYLPVDAVIMAGGKGTRLQPLTNDVPKPLLKVGDKTIIEHNIDRLVEFGIDDFWISVNYLGEKIEDYFSPRKHKNISINYVWENKPLGTIGAVSKIDDLNHKHILVTNSDILTNLDYEQFYLDFLKSNADLSIVSIPYNVDIPYAVLERDIKGQVKSFKEKPTYTYYSNGGIYLIKKSVLELIPKDSFFNATDLIEKLISLNKKVITYSFQGYWLDIGKHDDYKKAKEDINNINFS